VAALDAGAPLTVIESIRGAVKPFHAIMDILRNADESKEQARLRRAKDGRKLRMLVKDREREVYRMDDQLGDQTSRVTKEVAGGDTEEQVSN